MLALSRSTPYQPRSMMLASGFGGEAGKPRERNLHERAETKVDIVRRALDAGVRVTQEASDQTQPAVFRRHHEAP